MTTWTDIESQARAARQQAATDLDRLKPPETAIERVAYWTELAEAADAAKWEAVGDASSEGSQWWTIGLAAGADPEGVRQKYRRRTST